MIKAAEKGKLGVGMSVRLDSPPEAIGISELEKKFVRLRDTWKRERGPESATPRLVLHPAYQTIIGMGPSAIPFLLRELETQPDQWFWALQAITEENPVPPASNGNWTAMAQEWIAWGKKKGYL